MCGILAYIFNNASFEPSDEELKKFEQGLSLMDHRGPDNSNFKCFQGAVLGHRRLSILDLSPLGNQPFYSHDARYSIVYNGEIFNYLEIKNELIDLGCQFYTESDTEVLLQSYIYWGENCLQRLNGMFSFVIYDELYKSYFVARDHFGIKPLYFIKNSFGLIFSSEIKPLLLHLDSIDVNQEYLKSYFLDSSCDYGIGTLITQIFQIGPGSFMSSKSCGKQVKWFDLRKAVQDKIIEFKSQSIAQDYLGSLKKSIELRLRSDVPMALTLSGGMDSSSINAMVRELDNQIDLTAYTIGDTSTSGNQDSDVSESYLVSVMAKKFSQKLIPVLPPDKYSLDSVYESIYRQEFPSWSLSTVLYDKVYKTISSSGVKVIIEGHGNDEILGGYPVHLSALIHSFISRWKLYKAFKVAKMYKDSLNPVYYKNRKHEIVMFLANISVVLKRFLIILRHKRSWEFKIFRFEKHIHPFVKKKPLTYFQTQLINDVEIRIVPTVLRTFDRSTMGASIEMRPPFMDPNVVITSIALPDELRIGRFGQKSILRELMRDKLPMEIIENTVKKGFTGDIRNIINDIAEDKIFDLLNSYGEKLNICSEEFRKCYFLFKSNNDWQLAGIINRVIAALVWYDLYIEGKWKNYAK